MSLHTFFPPWDNDPAMYPGPALEQHQAHCRALELPYETHPAEVATLLTPEIRELGKRAAARYHDMVGWSPEGFDPADRRTVKADILDRRHSHRYLAFHGGRGGSKSHDAVEACVELASEASERVVVGREYLESIKDSSHKLFREKIKASRWANQWKITDREMTNVVTGSLITFMGVNRNPDSVRSLEGCTIFLGEEAEAFSDLSLEILLPTIRAGGSLVIFLWNPADAKSPMNQMFLAGDPPERSYIRCVLGENNRYFYRTEMPGERRTAFVKMTKSKYRHVWRGALDTNPDLLVFNNWRVGRVELPEEAVPRYGLDWGWQDPFACTESYVIEPEDPETQRGVIYIAKEVYGRFIPARDIPKMLRDTMPMIDHHWVTADSSEPKSIEDLSNAGISCSGARKGPGSIRAGISFLQGYDIVISPDCPNTQAEFEGYQWKQLKTGVITRDPEDDNNHAIDGIRYAYEDYVPGGGSGVDYV
jgi:phage terminase large subunit